MTRAPGAHGAAPFDTGDGKRCLNFVATRLDHPERLVELFSHRPCAFTLRSC